MNVIGEIVSEKLYPEAIWLAGPVNKSGYPNVHVSEKRGEIKHSMEGSFESAMNLLANIQIQASWHFSIKYDGTVYQHYWPTHITWHGGDKPQNVSHIGIEHEGVAGEPLTDAQTVATARLTAWLAGNRAAVRFPALSDDWELAEHNEYHPTACPSGRIPWDSILELLDGGEDVDEHYDGELNDRRWREVVQYWLSTGALRGRETPDGHIELLDDHFAPYTPPLIIPIPVPDWGKAT